MHRVSALHPFGRAAGSSFHRGSRFRKPPSLPGPSDFPRPRGSHRLSPQDLPTPPEAHTRARIPPLRAWFSLWLDAQCGCHREPGSASRRCVLWDARAVPRAPWPAMSAPPLRVVSTTTAECMPPLASLLRAHAPHHPPRAAFGSPIPHGFAECGEPLLEDGGARRSLCVSVPRGLDPDPGSVAGASAPGFPATIGLPPGPMGRHPARRRSATAERG